MCRLPCAYSVIVLRSRIRGAIWSHDPGFVRAGIDRHAESFHLNGYGGISSGRKWVSRHPHHQMLDERSRITFSSFRDISRGFQSLYNRKESAPKPFTSDSLRERILEFCKTPRSRKELAAAFSEITITHLMNKAIKPLIAEGKIGLTMPDKPKSKFQKYVTKPE